MFVLSLICMHIHLNNKLQNHTFNSDFHWASKVVKSSEQDSQVLNIGM
jgi:hypothetical protein